MSESCRTFGLRHRLRLLDAARGRPELVDGSTGFTVDPEPAERVEGRRTSPTRFARRRAKADGVRVLVLALVVVGCATATARVQPRRMTDLVISPTQRILVAGFVTDDGSPLDVNGETVRLLRDALRKQGALGVIRADPVTLTSEAAFQDIAYWRTIGEEHGAPLIVSGVVTLRRAAPNVIQRGGRAGAYDVQPGFLLETDLVLIDGATGRVMSSQHLRRQAQHGSGRRASPAVMYFAMIDRLMPDLVRAVFAPHSTTSRYP